MDRTQNTIKRKRELIEQLESLNEAIFDHKGYLFRQWVFYKMNYDTFDGFISNDTMLNELYYRADVLIRNPLLEK